MYATNTFATIGSNWKLQIKIQDTQSKIKLMYPILLRRLIFYFVDKNQYDAYFSISFLCNVSIHHWLYTQQISCQFSHSNVSYEEKMLCIQYLCVPLQVYIQRTVGDALPVKAYSAALTELLIQFSIFLLLFNMLFELIDYFILFYFK